MSAIGFVIGMMVPAVFWIAISLQRIANALER